MCTVIAMHGNPFLFGRNMDMDCGFGERVIVTPRNYPFLFRKGAVMRQHYAMIGMGAVREGYPLYADAVNEKGICMAGLHFPRSAVYAKEDQAEKASISPFELIPWVLGQCASVEEAGDLLSRTNLIDIPFDPKLPLTPLHWIVSDESGSIVLECMSDGMHLHKNPLGILTNEPPFPFHLFHLGEYLNLSPKNPSPIYGDTVPICGLGMGSRGLPGDYSSPSRFVKAAYLMLCSRPEGDTLSRVGQLFHILDAVAPVKGSVMTDGGSPHYTTYSCCMDAEQGLYYYQTFENRRIIAVSLHQCALHSCNLKEFSLQKTQDFLQQKD